MINVVGLSSALLAHAPRMRALGAARTIVPVFPAVTCSVQSSMLTGLQPRAHGIVGNGWYDRDLAEVHFWKQSNQLVQGEKVWETARKRDPSITTAIMFWWFNMHSSVDYSLTPRPIYKADGRKIPDCHSHPSDLRELLQAELGRFPLFQFWGPGASIDSSRWIAEASKLVHARHAPTLMLIYLPHLDYALQKFGPNDPRIAGEVAAIDAVAGDLVDHFRGHGVRVMIVSEYGIEGVDEAVAVNRILREAGLVRIREEDGCELLDAGGSSAFAVADHQVAHVYARDEQSLAAARDVLRSVRGIELILDRREQAAWRIDHERSGDLILVAAARRWFSYPYWLDDRRAPDFARTVDIHRKPGYDPLELFIDPAIRLPRLKVGWTLLKKRLGFRTLMDVIPLDTALVRGSHGRVDRSAKQQPILIAPGLRDDRDSLPCTAIRDVILGRLFDP